MPFSMAPLLAHSNFVPASARDALRTALAAPLEERNLHLESAAHILSRELGLDCGDARELVGLPWGPCGGEKLEAGAA